MSNEFVNVNGREINGIAWKESLSDGVVFDGQA